VRRLLNAIRANGKKFDPSRRRAFGAIGGLAATPIAAKEAIDKKIAEVAINGGVMLAPPKEVAGALPDAGEWIDRYVPVANYIKMLGVPDFVREHYRRTSTYVAALDPDIAALRSFSMSVKILMQRERNLERMLESLEYQGKQSRASTAFKAVTGWVWPF
jgi:hypothetical protein